MLRTAKTPPKCTQFCFCSSSSSTLVHRNSFHRDFTLACCTAFSMRAGYFRACAFRRQVLKVCADRHDCWPCASAPHVSAPQIEELIARLTDAESLAESLTGHRPALMQRSRTRQISRPDGPESKLGASGVWLCYRPDVVSSRTRPFFGRLASLPVGRRTDGETGRLCAGLCFTDGYWGDVEDFQK